MSDRFAVDTDKLANASYYLRDVADRLQGIGERLASTTGALGDCWGDDPMGQAFGAQYVKPARDMKEAIPGLAEAVRSTEDGLRTMDRGFTHVEESTVDSLGGFRGDVDVDGVTNGGGARHSG